MAVRGRRPIRRVWTATDIAPAVSPRPASRVMAASRRLSGCCWGWLGAEPGGMIPAMETAGEAAAGQGDTPDEPDPPRYRGSALSAAIILGAVVAVLVTALASSFRGDVIVAATFIAAAVAATPILGLQAKKGLGVLLMGSVLGGYLAAALYALGLGVRLSSLLLIVVELAALLLAPWTLRMLQRMRVPGIPAGQGLPTLVGVAAMIVLAPVALLAGFLDVIARYPVVLGAVAGAVGAVSNGWQGLLVAIPAAVALALMVVMVRRMTSRRCHDGHRRTGNTEQGEPPG